MEGCDWILACVYDDPVRLSRFVNAGNVNTITYTCDDETLARPFHFALRHGHYKCANWMHSIGAIINLDEDHIALVTAVAHVNVWWTRYLLRIGMDPNKDERSISCAFICVFESPDRKTIIRLLLFAGSRLHLQMQPKWIKEIVADVARCKEALALIRRSPSMQSQPRSVVDLIMNEVQEELY